MPPHPDISHLSKSIYLSYCKIGKPQDTGGGNSWKSVLPFYHLHSGAEFGLSVCVASTFLCWAISMAHQVRFFKRHWRQEAIKFKTICLKMRRRRKRWRTVTKIKMAVRLAFTKYRSTTCSAKPSFPFGHEKALVSYSPWNLSPGHLPPLNSLKCLSVF